jgi:hypothetical protein
MKGAEMNTDKAIARIGALLLRAEHTNYPHEAEACITRAQTLATLNSIDLAVARARASQLGRQVAPLQKTVTIGTARQRGLRTFVDLFLVIARANDVKIDIARNFTEVYVFGYAEDIAVTEALYTRLVTDMVTTCENYLATGDYKHETTARANPSDVTGGPYTSVSKVSARLEFHCAFTARIKVRLNAARRDAQAAAAADATRVQAARPAGGNSLVLAGKQLQVQDFYTANSIAKGRRYRGHRSSSPSPRGRAAGDRAGQNAQLDNPTELAGPPAALTGSRP